MVQLWSHGTAENPFEDTPQYAFHGKQWVWATHPGAIMRTLEQMDEPEQKQTSTMAALRHSLAQHEKASFGLALPSRHWMRELVSALRQEFRRSGEEAPRLPSLFSIEESLRGITTLVAGFDGELAWAKLEAR